MGIAVNVATAAAVVSAREIAKALGAAWVVAHGGCLVELPVVAFGFSCDGWE